MFCSGINFVAEFPSFRVADWKILTGCRGEDDGLTLLTPSWHPATAMTTLTPSSPRVTNGFEFAGFHNNTILVLGDKESWSSWPRETGGERVTHDTAEMMLKMKISWRWWSAEDDDQPMRLKSLPISSVLAMPLIMMLASPFLRRRHWPRLLQ